LISKGDIVKTWHGEGYNKDQARRDEILEQFWTSDWFGGIRRFERLPIAVVLVLGNEGFLDPEDRQNDAPSLGEITKFMALYPEFTAHGYAVTKDRQDYRVTFEGVQGTPRSAEAVQVFTEMFRFADDFVLGNECYAWFD
jgi:hypothetical protein